MEFKETLAKRRMIRNYTDEPVSVESLDRIARSALRAPSAGNSQAIGVVVITNDLLKKDIAEIADEDTYVAKGFDAWISSAAAHIVITVSEHIYRQRYSEPDKTGPDGETIVWPIPYWWVDAGAALMAVLLAAVDEELAAGFLGVHSVPDLARRLSLPDDHIPIGVVTVGHPAPDRRSSSLDRPKKRLADVIHHDGWGSSG